MPRSQRSINWNGHAAAAIYRYTWMCSIFHSIHPNTTGYRVITHASEQRTIY